MLVPLRLSCLPAALLTASLLAGSVAAQEPAQRILVLDQDAHAASDTVAGAVFNADLGAPAATDPLLEIAADGGVSQFSFVSGMALSPVDGSLYLSDLGTQTGTAADGAILRHEQGTGLVTTLVAPGEPLLPDPFAIAFTGDGTLLVIDWESDPSGFGADWVGGGGHGALFSVNTSTGAISLISDGTNHDVPGIDPSESVFQDPMGVAWDPVTGLAYVADFSADGDDDGFFNGTLFSVDLGTGAVKVVSAYWNFAAPGGVTMRPDGRPLVVDAVQDDSVLFEIDLTATDLTDNVTFITSSTQYSLLENATVDEANRIFVVDIGEWDDVDMEFVVPPGVYRVDESQRGSDPDFDLDNSIPVVEYTVAGDTILSPVNIEVVPVPVVDTIMPTQLTGPTNVRFDGRNLHSQVDFDFGGALSVTNLAAVPGAPFGTAYTADLGPTGAMDCSPALTPTHPFGGGRFFDNALTIGDAPALPFSGRGDGNRDGTVDGLDLAMLGRLFGTGACQFGLFDNDVDFNDDDLIDGDDLVILMTYFGTNP